MGRRLLHAPAARQRRSPDDADLDARTDAELILATRAGSAEAYGELWIRHEKVAAALAASLSQADPDDLVAEAFIRILRALRAGKGPTDTFRAYLCTTVRSCAVDEYRHTGRTLAVGNLHDLDEGLVAPTTHEVPESGDDARAAWETLSKREQWLMWASAVQGFSTAEMADRLGVRPATAAVWVHRARERLRAGFLARHLEPADDPRCQAQRDRFIAYLRGRLSARRTAEVAAHLEDCSDCERVMACVGNVNQRLRGVVWPLLPLAGQQAVSALQVAHRGSRVLGHAGGHLLGGKVGTAGASWVAAASIAGVGVASAVVMLHAATPPQAGASPSRTLHTPPIPQHSLVASAPKHPQAHVSSLPPALPAVSPSAAAAPQHTSAPATPRATTPEATPAASTPAAAPLGPAAAPVQAPSPSPTPSPSATFAPGSASLIPPTRPARSR